MGEERASGTAGPPEDAEELARRLAAALGRLSRAWRRGSPAELGPGAVSTLSTLLRCGPMRIGDLAAREGVAPPTTTRVVAVLEEAGYVVRAPDPHDRRAVRVEATELGRSTVMQLRADRAAVLAVRLAALPPAQREAIVAALPGLEALAETGA
ncbi:MAG: MarR family transcriptional regulator [Kineosporiaceae bacterium]